jgi:hypothetical protein
MGLLSYLGSVYSVSTLDSRFITPSSVPYKTLADSRNDPLSTNSYAEAVKAKAEPSKWRTREFYTYYFCLAFLIIPSMWWVGYSVSRRMTYPRPPSDHLARCSRRRRSADNLSP